MPGGRLRARTITRVHRVVKPPIGSAGLTGNQGLNRAQVQLSIREIPVCWTGHLSRKSKISQAILARTTKMVKIKQVKNIEKKKSTSPQLTETDVAIVKHGLESEWPDGMVTELGGNEDVQAVFRREGRLDLSELPLVTIDGADAMDFDDAVAAREERDGWTLWVAIADVSHYVRIGSLLDQAASERGTSVYFPDRVIPMLPESLSNDLCSLRPGKHRLALIAVIDVSREGEVRSWRFERGMMRSHARLTYEEVGSYLASGQQAAPPNWSEKVRKAVDDLADIAVTLRTFRDRQGTIEFNFSEALIDLSGQGDVKSISIRERNPATKLIEECMLAANVCAARSLQALGEGIYRIHDAPSAEDVSHLRSALGVVGLKLPGKQHPSVKDMQSALDGARKKIGQDKWVQMLLLRSLKQACYVSSPSGHFALGFSLYTHFTSPIRRYPDLIVHRLLKGIHQWEGGALYDQPDGLLGEIAARCSMTERQSEDAVREVTAQLKARYMRGKIGDEFSGVITSVTEFGVFVELDELPVDGLVHVSQLGRDYYRFEPEKMQLIGERTAKRFRPGDALCVVVAGVDISAGQVSFWLPGVRKSGPSRSGRKDKRSKKRH